MKLNLHILLYIAFSVVVTVLVMMLINGSGKSERMIRNEVKLEQLEKDRVKDSLSNAEVLKAKDELIETLKQKDTVYSTKIIQSNDKLKTVPATVNSLSIEELLHAAHNY